MGFCLFNNAAVGAAKLAADGERVAIVDWDVHHGNGTQDMFYDDPRVLYVSTHQSPLYPGTGQLRETGAGDGAGTHAQPSVPGRHRRRHVSAPRSTTSWCRWSNASRPTG